VLESLRTGKKTVGIKQTLKSVLGDSAKQVFIANDAEEKVVFELKETCQKSGIEIEYVENMRTLGKACGIEVGAAVACLLKD
jgi:large subunit ribosomal protein L7A